VPARHLSSEGKKAGCGAGAMSAVLWPVFVPASRAAVKMPRHPCSYYFKLAILSKALQSFVFRCDGLRQWQNHMQGSLSRELHRNAISQTDQIPQTFWWSIGLQFALPHSRSHQRPYRYLAPTIASIHSPHSPCALLLMPRLSGLQKDVLSLYRRCLRACRQKPADTRPNFESFTRKEFEKTRTLNKKDFSTIEFLLRKGTRQLEIYESPGVRNIAG